MFPPMSANCKLDQFLNSSSYLTVKIMKGDENRMTYINLVGSSCFADSRKQDMYKLKREFTTDIPCALEGWKNGAVLANKTGIC